MRGCISFRCGYPDKIRDRQINRRSRRSHGDRAESSVLLLKDHGGSGRAHAQHENLAPGHRGDLRADHGVHLARGGQQPASWAAAMQAAGIGPSAISGQLVAALAETPEAWLATPRICYAFDPGRVWYDGGIVGLPLLAGGLLYVMEQR